MDLVDNDICKVMVVVGSFLVFWMCSRNNTSPNEEPQFESNSEIKNEKI